MLFNLYYYNTVLRHKELHISHKQYKKRGIKMINEKRVKELFVKRNSSTKYRLSVECKKVKC